MDSIANKLNGNRWPSRETSWGWQLVQGTIFGVGCCAICSMFGTDILTWTGTTIWIFGWTMLNARVFGDHEPGDEKIIIGVGHTPENTLANQKNE